MTILWISKNEPLPQQRAELERLFGRHTLLTDCNPFLDAGDLAARIRQANAREVVCIAPMTVLKKLLEFGIRPLNAEMTQIPQHQADVHVPARNGGQRHYKFVKFRRLTAIDMTYEEITPATAVSLQGVGDRTR